MRISTVDERPTAQQIEAEQARVAREYRKIFAAERLRQESDPVHRQQVERLARLKLDALDREIARLNVLRARQVAHLDTLPTVPVIV